MTETSRPLAAAVWMTGAILAFSSMAIAGRAISQELDTFELMMYRSLIGVGIVSSFALASSRLHEVRTQRLGIHLIRNVMHFFGQNLWFYALTLIPLAQLFALEFTSPIWVVVLAVFILGERMTPARLATITIGFVGAMIVARPGLGGSNIGILTAAAAAVGFAGSIVITKLLTRTETITCILFWLTLLQLGMGIVMAGWDGDVAWPSLAMWPWVVLVGIAGLLAHTCLTNALMIAPATVVVPMDFLRLPAIALVGMAFYDEPLDRWVFIGATIIFAGNYLNIWLETRRATVL